MCLHVCVQKWGRGGFREGAQAALLASQQWDLALRTIPYANKDTRTQILTQQKPHIHKRSRLSLQRIHSTRIHSTRPCGRTAAQGGGPGGGDKVPVAVLRQGRDQGSLALAMHLHRSLLLPLKTVNMNTAL